MALAVVALFATLALAACGDDSSDADGSGDGSNTTDRTATNTSESPFVADIDGRQFKLAQSIQDKLENGEQLNYVLSVTGTSVPIFSAAMDIGFKRGVKAASQRFPVSGEIIGPAQQDIATQVSQMRSVINSSQVDCLTFNAVQPGAFVSVVNQAMAKGIPVFAVNADSPDSARIAFYALNEVAAGRQAGQIAGEQIKAQGLDVKRVALTSGDPAGPWAQDRIQGFVEGLNSELPDVEFANDPANPLPTTFEPQEVYAAVRSYLTGNPDVDLVFSTDQGVEQIDRVIADLKKDGEVYGVGFNLSPAIVKGIQEGRLITSIGQGWNKQAEAGVKACTDFLLDGKVPTPEIQELEPVPVTRDNAKEIAPTVEKGGG